MGELVNLNRARKARDRAADRAQAIENRARFGQSKTDKARLEAERLLAAKRLDEAERET